MKELPIAYQVIADRIKEKICKEDELPLKELRWILGKVCRIPKDRQTRVVRELVDMGIIKIVKLQRVILLV